MKTWTVLLVEIGTSKCVFCGIGIVGKGERNGGALPFLINTHFLIDILYKRFESG